MLQPKKPVVKKPTKNKPKLGGEIGRPPFTNEERKKMPKVGSMGSAKNGKSFHDLNKDGKVTRADILKGRGVIAKKGASVKKMQYGGADASMVPMKKGGVVKKAGMHKMPNGSMMKNSAMKSGGKMAKCKYGCN
jgi:hypothetical protein